MSSFFSQMLYVFFSANRRLRHRGVQGGICPHAAVWQGSVMGNGGMGESSSCCSSFHALSEEMRRVFDRAVVGREAARRLADLRQGERSVSDFSIEFRPWRRSASGTRRRSGTCSCMGWLTGSRGRYSVVSCPLVWTG